MSNSTPLASTDLFSTVPCNSDWQWTAELLPIWLGAPLSTVSRSCSKQLKTLSSLAGGVAFVPYCTLYSMHSLECCYSKQWEVTAVLYSTVLYNILCTSQILQFTHYINCFQVWPVKYENYFQMWPLIYKNWFQVWHVKYKNCFQMWPGKYKRCVLILQDQSWHLTDNVNNAWYSVSSWGPLWSEIYDYMKIRRWMILHNSSPCQMIWSRSQWKIMVSKDLGLAHATDTDSDQTTSNSSDQYLGNHPLITWSAEGRWSKTSSGLCQMIRLGSRYNLHCMFSRHTHQWAGRRPWVLGSQWKLHEWFESKLQCKVGGLPNGRILQQVE